MPRDLNFGFRNKRDWAIYVAKTRALISCAITAQLGTSHLLPAGGGGYIQGGSEIFYGDVLGGVENKMTDG